MEKVQKLKNEVQETQWENIIAECRSSGMSATKWCAENGIDVKSHYYRLRKMKERTCEQIPVPVEIIPSVSSPVTITSNGIEAEILERASFETISAVIKAMEC